jgi:hypothetical protein
MLLILGTPGIGKTFQVRQICKAMGVHCEVTSGATFQGHEGQSQKALFAAYTRAVKHVFDEMKAPYSQPKRQSVLLIDDFHLSLASVMLDNFSQNSQIFMASLMSGCDDPRTLFAPYDSMPFVRVPIVATANPAKNVYGPILRHGRARLFQWEPTREDRIQMALVHLARLQRDDVRDLAYKYCMEPPVFFRELVNRLCERAILQLIHANRKPEREAVLAIASQTSIVDIQNVAKEIKHSEAFRALELDE